MIDLHAHSTASDGTDSPQALVGNAVANGVRTLAITDHDTTGGWEAASTAVAALRVPFTLIRGAEFSCVHFTAKGARISVHLLGYLFDPTSAPLRDERARLRESRFGRGAAIVANMVKANVPITWARVVEIADGGSVGRPHIGRALVEAGVVESVDEAFADLLSNSSKYYVPKQDMPVLDAIRLIRLANGVPVIAHPWARKRGSILDEATLAALVGAGMLGIEVDHVDHSAEDRIRLRALAAELGVFATGSSDYHGHNKPNRLGDEVTDSRVLELIVEAASGVEPIQSPAR